jgi:succinylglutamate desuccinylase
LDNLFETYSNDPIYFIDLHTTSSKTLPFITINDALINRKFSHCFPVPVVLGIEEYLEGPLLSYLNTLGYVSLGFEAGQHTDPEAVKNCEAFIYLTLHHIGNLLESSVKTLKQYETDLNRASKNISSTFEVVCKHQIESDDIFKMLDGFKSFQYIKKGTPLAYSNDIEIVSNYNAQLFMPLYQNAGEDGFFIIKRIPKFFLKLSEILRRTKADALLTWLPGIYWYDKPNGVLKANLSIARFLTKSIFHLFGYRNKQLSETQILLYNRERVAKKGLYKTTPWYHKKSRN